ncbi:hypothetical protein DFH29DRAFT_976725 [Suillus ampliporus]|nr:hypothetical protein DFH29DRAFT_976725 [Suillus ampliporus]
MKSLPGPISSSIPFGTDPPPSPSSFSTFDKRPSLKSKITDAFRSSHRRRSSSVKSLGAPRTLVPRLRTLYQCAAIHICIPPAGVSYRGLPFFELRSGDTFDVLREYGHPSADPDLPLYKDDKEDHLLLVKVADEGMGGVGWALAILLGRSLSPICT